jgi:hypothetical protein
MHIEYELETLNKELKGNSQIYESVKDLELSVKKMLNHECIPARE